MSDAPRTIGQAIYGDGPKSAPQGPLGDLAVPAGAGAYRGLPIDSLPLAADPATVVAGSRATSPASTTPAAPAEKASASTMYGRAGQPVAPPGKPAPAAPAADDTPFDVARVTLPEGYEAHPEVLGEFGNVAKELGLKQKGADRLMALHARATEQAIAKQTEAWTTEAQNYFGESLHETVGLIRSKIGNDEDSQQFMQLMQQTGLGSNRHVITILRRLAKGG